MMDSIRQRIAAKAIIVDADDRILILKQSDHELNAGNGGFWDFAGGKLKPGESILDGLVREVFDETGLKVNLASPHRPIYVSQWTPTIKGVPTPITALFYVCPTKLKTIQISGQHIAYHWITENELNQFQLFPETLAAAQIYYSEN